MVDTGHIELPTVYPVSIRFQSDQPTGYVVRIFEAVKNKVAQTIENRASLILLNVLGNVRMRANHCIAPASIIECASWRWRALA